MKLTYFESDDRIIILYHALIFKNLFHGDEILSQESYKNNDKIFVDNISNPRFATNGTDKYYTINNGVIKSYKYHGLGKITGTFVKYMPSTNPVVTGIKFYCNYNNTSYINIIDKDGNILLSKCVIDRDVKNMMLDTYSKQYPGLNKPKDVPLYATIDKNGNPVIYWYSENKIIGKVNVTKEGEILKKHTKSIQAMKIQERIYIEKIGERFLIVSEGIDLNSSIRVLTTPKLSPKLISKALFELSKEYPLYRRDFNKAANKNIKYSTISIVPIKGIFFLSFLVNDNNEAISGFYRYFEKIPSEPDSLLGVKMNGDIEKINLNDLKQK